MGKRIDKWLTAQGLALLGGWRRQGDDLKEIAKKIGVSRPVLRQWAAEHAKINEALQVDKEIADFMVEEVLFNKSLAGDPKAYEFWLKHRMPGKWGKPAEAAAHAQPADHGRLAELINNPVEREGDFE